MKNIIIIILIFSSCQKADKLYFAKNDAEIKKISFEKKLNGFQIYTLIQLPLSEQVAKEKQHFKITNHDLKICITSQIILETGFLKSKLLQINNVLGIKKLSLRPYFDKMTIEYSNGKKITKKQSFASFYSISDCLHNYFTIIKGKRFLKVRQAKNYYDYCIALQNCGYATDPEYAIKLISIIKKIKEKMIPDLIANDFNNR